MMQLVDSTARCGVDEETIDIETDVADNGRLYKAIMQNTIKMINAISEQMVEFDNERKQADVQAGEKLHNAVEAMHRAMVDNTSKIESSMAVMEKEILEGQRHIEIVQWLEAVHQHAQCSSNHDPILHAIQELNTTDLSEMVHESSRSMHGLLSTLHETHGELHAKHDKLLQAVSGMASPQINLEPLHRHFSSSSEWMADHGVKVRTMEQRLQALERSSLEMSGTASAILAAVQDLTAKPLKAIQEDVKATRAAVQKDFGDLRGQVGDLRSQLQGHRAEVSDLLKKHSDKSLALLDSHGKILRENHSGVMKAMGDNLDVVDGKFKKHGTDILSAMDRLPDHNKMWSATAELLRDHTDSMSRTHGHILESFKDHAAAVQFNSDKHIQEIGNAMSEFPDPLSVADVERVMDGSLGAFQQRIMASMSSLHDHDRMAEAVHRRLEGLLTSIPELHDHDRTAEAVHRRIEESLARVGDHSSILDALGGLDLSEHEKRMLQAIDAMHEASMTAVLDAITGINMSVNINGKEATKFDAVDRAPAAAKALLRSAVATSSRPGSPPPGSCGWSTPSRNPCSPTEASKSQGGERNSGSRSTTPPTRRVLPDTGSGGYSPIKSTTERRARSARLDYTVRSPIQKDRTEPVEHLSCRCGFTCGTEPAMQKHLDRFRGEWGHSIV